MIDFLRKGISWLDVDMVRNEVQHIVQAADPATYPDRAGIRYYLDVEVPEYPQATSFKKMIRLEGREKPVKISDGAEIYEGCTFRIEALLAGQMTLTLPEKGQSNLSVVASLTTPYQLREVIEPAIRDQLLTARTAMRAGLALRDFVSYEHRFFSRFQPANMQFLTWQPKVKLIGAAQEEYLYFLVNLTPLPTQINLRVRVTYANGTRAVLTKNTIQSASAFQVVCAPVGPVALGLGDASIIKYEVWLADENMLRFTEVRTYEIDRRRHRFERFILFANSFGGFDTLRLLGKSSEDSDVTRQTAVKERDAAQGIDYSELAIISIKENSGIQVSTGLFERDQEKYLSYLRELMLSECILEDTAHGYEAVNLITGSITYREDNAGLMERSFQFRRTHSDTNFSSLAPVSAAPARATAWRGVGNVYLLDGYGKRTGMVKAAALRKYYTDNGSDVVPLTQKANVEGDKDYLIPSPDPSTVPGSTPFPNAAINRKGTFVKNNCGAAEEGMEAMISIPAGTYGAEKAGISDALAEAAWNQLNTQEYANLYGSCAIGQNYTWAVPAGHFHYRTNMPSRVGVYYVVDGAATRGNIQSIQGMPGSYIFPVGSNDLDFPNDPGYYYNVYGETGQTIKIEIFQNGTLRTTLTRSFPVAGYANESLFFELIPAALDRYLIKLTIL
ncbi:DUF5977 domain-containing protein [Dyadobacter sp. 32]|uniref:DUF5977 domain-containing protein n=1 Tax=Dyadobacter sp. 32 TaxID=538966 RepID=UPI0011EE74BC